ncbi:sensor domain-containing diguanylate cyclase [Pullulanibacillus sp. KACC 23026]|uniref:sensor domain-containing diguanylate cyclase n=1 Tax=Pullulanibacillus sp. KACC 23026 TaxID=3028315 RepID=UPI0023AE77FC|nr:sensor domain-containing diguanylate cyclase [Pullulanibacillus sp. KACC 23026]WEG14670.1 sensor domain-containing diguanylate cyclase [Pullulanibacillus sp. KACC 23026]
MRIMGIIYILIVLALVELFESFGDISGLPDYFLSILIPCLNLLLLVVLFIHLRRVFHQFFTKEKQYQQLLDHSPEAIYVHRNGVLIYSNDAGAKLFGYNEPSELINRPWKEVLDPNSYASLKESSNRYSVDQQFKVHQFKLYKPDGSICYIDAKSTYIEFNGQPAREVIARDITVQEIRQEMLKKYSYIDPLTELPNRRSLLGQLEQLIRESKQTHTSFGMMFVDLDGFKQINDTYGHDKGDHLLREISEYLKRCIKPEDVVGRFGGDEFIVILPRATQWDCLFIAKKLIDNMPLFTEEQKAHQVTLSIGISLYPQNAEDVHTLIKQADEAMYAAKKQGKNNYKLAE